MTRTRVKQLLGHGAVWVNGVAVRRHDHPVKPGDVVCLTGPKNRTLPKLPIVYEDEAIVVVEKPASLLTVATGTEKDDTAFRRLAGILPARPAVVHRLDRETSGLLLFARSHAVRDRLQTSWDRVQKVYLAVVEGTPQPREGLIDNFLIEGKNLRVRTCRPNLPGAKRAVSRYRVLRSGPRYSLIEVTLDTGRKHQIRVHLAGLGCPVIGDVSYGAKTSPARRLGLHASRLTFDHPLSGRRIIVESPLPSALARIV